MKPNLFSLSRLLCEMLSQGVFGDSKQFEAVFLGPSRAPDTYSALSTNGGMEQKFAKK